MEFKVIFYHKGHLGLSWREVGIERVKEEIKGFGKRGLILSLLYSDPAASLHQDLNITYNPIKYAKYLRDKLAERCSRAIYRNYSLFRGIKGTEIHV